MLLAGKVRLIQFCLVLYMIVAAVLLTCLLLGWSSPVLHGVGYVSVLALAVMGAVGLQVAYRRYGAILRAVHDQIHHFLKTRQMGLIMLDTHEELADTVSEINKYLTFVKFNLEKDQQALKELSLRASVAETEKRQAEAVIYSISDAVLVIDRYEELILANEAAEDLFDFSLEKNYRSQITQVIAEPLLIDAMNQARQEGQVSAALDYRRSSHDREYNLKIHSSAVYDENRQIIGVVVVIHDVTAEQELARLKDDFVSCVSHELKTPLASIRAYAEMLVERETDNLETQHQFCTIIQDQADQLNRLIDDILNISRIEAGVAVTHVKSFDVMKLIDEVVNMMRPQLDARKMRLKILPHLSDPIVQADRDLLFHALLNLVCNAVKYSPAESTVTLRLNQSETGQLVIDVEDEGEGIPDELREKIFEKFYRVSPAVSPAGTGLGLYVAREIVQTLHGGTLSVTSDAASGSRFRMILPQPPMPPRLQPPVTAVATGLNRRKDNV